MVGKIKQPNVKRKRTNRESKGHPGDRYTYYGKRLDRNNMAGPPTGLGYDIFLIKLSRRKQINNNPALRSALSINVVGVALKQNHIITQFFFSA